MKRALITGISDQDGSYFAKHLLDSATRSGNIPRRTNCVVPKPWQVANYREAYGLYACSGILFNHESPLRPERFVTKKIALAAARIARGLQKELLLRNTSIQRDWGWAPEYVEAMHAMLQRDQAEDFVIATGRSCSLQEFVEVTFQHLNAGEKPISFREPKRLIFITSIRQTAPA